MAAQAPRKVWRRVDGVLLLDKPQGMTSNAALQKARRLFSAAKAGHTGTLDPMATGLLPLCFGEATKFSADLLDADKTYEADVLFGATTDTGDADGVVVKRRPVTFSAADLVTALAAFRGPILQVPPMYSALKRDGRPLYELARQGVEVERAPRAVTIHELTLLSWSGERCRVRVRCSKGTYIRTLAEDVGERLDCGAHLVALRRIGVGDLDVTMAVTLEQIEALAEEVRAAMLQSPDALLQSLPKIMLPEGLARRFTHGNPVEVGVGDNNRAVGKCRVYADTVLLGVGDLGDDGRLAPRRLVSA
ncbi:tRNA pseudouridine(55) synthase TruB [Propionivibrio dicarboxylicus]|uniref:tRNA pseudouridine(55) synthase TruB n=1 Tax=Propionivibrio dicarboxylicus TaxID=83767 RepID=UPI0024820B1E|nr:tRNA pseudouridine(55) synthase TruB [Propionivibrio dicarboxylicus]